MIFDWIDWSKKYEFIVILTKKNKKPIAILSEAYDRNLEVNVDTFNKFSFTVPKYTSDRFTHEQIENSNYDKVIEENMVLVKAFEEGKPNDIKFQSYFIIKNTEENTDESAKKVDCSSREVMLNKNIITLDGVERQLKKTEVSISDGIFDIIEQNSTWKLGHIDESCMYDNVGGGTVPKFRWFDALSKPIYQFLMEDVQSAYDVVLVFNSVDKTIDCYDRSTWGNHTGIILSEENYIKGMSKKTSSDNIVTKLEVSGRDGLGISDVNIWGGDYIYNWDFFKNGQMSDELIEASDKYETLLETKNTEFQSLRTQVVDVLSQIDIKNGEMTQLNEELKALRLIQAGYMTPDSHGNDPINDGSGETYLSKATKDVNNKVIAIANKQAEITSLTTQKDNLNTQINQIALDIRTDNAKDSNGNLIFDDDLREELEDFTYCESWSNDYYANSDALLKGGQDVLKDWAVPTISFDVSMADIFGTPETYKMWDKLNFKNGDFVRFYSKRFKINVDERIVGYQYGIDKNDLKISFSNKDKKSDDARSIGSAIKKGAEGAKIVNTKKLEWDNVKDLKDAVDLYLNNALDLNRQRIISQVGKNKIDISENGIFCINVENENEQIAILSGLVAITTDQWESCSTAIDSTGVYASVLCGKMLLGENLYIVNEANNVIIDKNGITIKDERYTTILSSKGVCNTQNIPFVDSVDSSHKLLAEFFVDDNVNLIDKVSLKLSCQNYRAFSRSADYGGITAVTSEDNEEVSNTSGSNIVNSDGTISIIMGTAMNAFEQDTTTEFDNGNGTHFHRYTVDAPFVLPDHRHVVTIKSHHHNVKLSSHTHQLIFGLFERNRTLGTAGVYINGVWRMDIYNDRTIVDITQYITKGWMSVEIASPDLNRYIGTIVLRTYIGM